jgi:hypothetical protein
MIQKIRDRVLIVIIVETSIEIPDRLEDLEVLQSHSGFSRMLGGVVQTTVSTDRWKEGISCGDVRR